MNNVTIRSWSEDNLTLLKRLMGDAAMTVYLGGPETPEVIHKRHERYCQLEQTGKGCMFVIVFGAEKIAAGSVGYWEMDWKGQLVWEVGWSVLPEFQGQGIAKAGTKRLMDHVRGLQSHRYVHAFPSIDNAASNALCRNVGFVLNGEVELEDWQSPGNFLRFHDWSSDLFAYRTNTTT